MLTFVSAFLDLSEDRTTLRSFQTYMNHFKKLAETGVNIYLFLNRSCTWYEPFPNVHVEYIESTELTTYLTEATLPSVRTVEKDTFNYFMLINAKPEFVARAIRSNVFPSSHYYWIDFGIFHVIKDTEAAQKYLIDLSTKGIRDGLIIPGCCEKRDHDYFNRVCWRFCGGVFAGDRASLLAFYETVSREYKNVPLTWEVNLWAYLESQGKISPEWILADHNDSVIRLG